MNHEIIKNVIFDQHEVIKKTIIYDRDYTLQNDVNYILVGLRRAGKSTLLYKKVLDLVNNGVDWKRIIYINFEDERLIEFNSNDFQDILLVAKELSNETPYYFFDEIQNIDNWELFARRLADYNERVCITGSNSKMLSSEMNAKLGGRYITKYIMPYSFGEYLRVIGVVDNGSTSSKGLIYKYEDEYLKNGGLPASVNLINKKEYISSVFQKLFFNDILIHNGIRNENAMRVLIKKLAETVKDEISFTKIYGIMKTIGFSISKDTIIDYVGYIVQSNLLFSIQNFYASFVDKESTPKYYFTDNGILNLFLLDKNSRLLENAVAISLKRYGQDYYYLKSSTTKIDIDFYVPSINTAIQVTYSLDNLDSSTREIDNLIKYHRTNKDSKLVIVTLTETKQLIIEGTTIEVMSFYEFVTKILK
ncbi:MAG: ATP-binding protein [Bacilli bacterium]|nr:ATP-binding protein [Bacilli bacterium]